MADQEKHMIRRETGSSGQVAPGSWEQARSDIEGFAGYAVETVENASREDVRRQLSEENIDLSGHKSALHQRLAALRAQRTPAAEVPEWASAGRQEAVRSRWSSPLDTATEHRVSRARFLLAGSLAEQLLLDPVAAIGRALEIPPQSMVALPRDIGRHDRFTTETAALEGAARKRDLEKEKWIQAEAEAILRATDAMYPPIYKHFEKLGSHFGLLCENVRLPKSTVEGATIMDGRVGAILINTSIQQASRRQFTWAHELGHYVLHSDLGQRSFRDSYGDLHRFDDELESEANLFAASLLLPKSHLVEIYNPKSPPNLAAVNRLIDRWKVSPLAAMYRVTRATEHPCVLLVYKDGKLSWHLPSPAFEGEVAPEYSAPPESSTTAGYVRSGSDAQNKHYSPNTPAEWWITKGAYSHADESTFNLNRQYVYTLLTFYR